MKEKFEIFKNEKIVINVRSKKQYDEFMKICEEQGFKWGNGSFPTQESYYKKYKENTCINLNNLRDLSYDGINFYKNTGYKIINYKDFIKEGNMKYKIGDKVKVVDAGELYSAYKDFIKENAPQLLNKWVSSRKLPKSGIYEVKALGKHLSCGRELAIIEQNNKVYIVDFKGLELVKEFTKSDLKDNHIVVLRDKTKHIWKDFDFKKEFNNDLTHNAVGEVDIIEVWEFETLVWKREESILDEVEKKYLGDVIRPFRDRVEYIAKRRFHETEFIFIQFDNAYIDFPAFNKGTMYKRMEIEKEYTLEELGLERYRYE